MVNLSIKNLSGNLNKIVFVLALLCIIFTLSLFIAPLTLEAGTVEGLDGAANRVVYSEKWEELPLYQRVVYHIGDFNCHQMHERSYYVGGNQMPVCARDLGIFAGASIGLLVMSFARGGKDYKDILIENINLDTNMSQDNKLIILLIVGAIFALPLVLDGSIQLVSDYESFNELRTITGVLFGFGFSAFISSILLSVPSVGHYGQLLPS